MIEQSENELRAMIMLLEDPDEVIFDEIRSKLLDMGAPAIPALENVWESTFNPGLQSKIEDIIQHIQFNNVKDELRLWADSGGTDLLAGTLLIARYQYPDLDEEEVRKQIEIIKKDIWIELNPNLTAFEKINVINHVLFDVYHFTGNTTNYHAPQNSYINNVLESKRGNPLLLSILYSCIAQGLNIPVFGVNLPEHFILAYVDEYQRKRSEDEEESILFYINPFSRGAVFSRREIDIFLQQLNLEPRRMFYESCPNTEIIKRQLRNLIASYEKLGYPEKVAHLTELLDILTYHAGS
ncbi:MAG: transglutaminase family protein [Bacteroidetes bacterium]|nr:transglutaminase family protein [Bacteroidota bacterium]